MLKAIDWLQETHHRWLGGILLGGLLLRLVIAVFLPIGFDEAYYYIYTQHPNWSYFDHPPLVFVTTGVGVWLTGAVNPFTVRLGTLLLYTGSLYFFYRAATKLFDRQVGLIALGLVSLMPILIVAFGSLTLPDTPLVFFWMLTLWVASNEFFGSQPYRPTYRVAVIGLLVGLACLGKYHGFFLGACLILFCLVSPSHRRVLTSPWVVLASLLFSLAIAPILYWNSGHDWASFVFQSSRALPQSGYNWESFIVTFLVHMLYLFPSLGFPLVAIWGRRGWQQLRPRAGDSLTLQRRFILCLSVPIVVFFAIVAGYQQVLPSWPMAAYMTGTILLAEWVRPRLQRSPRLGWRWLGTTGVIVVLLVPLALSHLVMGTFQKPSAYALGGGWLPIAGDTSTELIDVSQLQQKIAASPAVLGAIERSDFIFINRYFPSGQLAMALHGITNKPLTCFDGDLRGFAYWSRAEEWVGKNGVYIGSETFQATANISPSTDPNSTYAPLGDYFKSMTPVATIPLTRGGVVTQTWRVFAAQEMLKPYPRPYGLKATDG